MLYQKKREIQKVSRPLGLYAPYGLIVFSLLLFVEAAFGLTKNFKGLFGSYHQEKYIENEGNFSDLGFEILMSTIFPLEPVVKTSQQFGYDGTPMQYTTFFNGEAQVSFSLGYNFEFFGGIGYYSYDTREVNAEYPSSSGALQYQRFSMSMVPVFGGVRYRFSSDDIVPYLGVAAGESLVTRTGYYDYTSVESVSNFWAPMGMVLTGIEFYISSRVGIRLEASAAYFALPSDNFDPGGLSLATYPMFNFDYGLWTLRYASGIFFLL